ncbi:hypothetical protein N431DRAFT_490578 [Stipitochalara longipes BDJ]|nr:hypothetical protein N431DRAFT_490578 [Stipitochalara longipes BDJ]
MEGAKSLGCSTCKFRKVRCDLRYPICKNCERTKRQCSGSKASFILFHGPGLEEHMRGDGVPLGGFPTEPSFSQSESLASTLVSRLEGIKEIGYQKQILGNFFQYLPSRVGHNLALDAALRCTLSSHHNFIAGKLDTGVEALKDYHQALCMIRRDVNHFQERTPSETICAALLLSHHETFRQTSGDKGFIAHAGGVSAIIEAWGPERINSDFDLAIFGSHYGSCVATSVFTGKECFLNSPAWEAVRLRSLNIKAPLDGHASEFLALMGALPILLKRLQKFDPADPSSCPLDDVKGFKSKLTKSAAILQQDFESPGNVVEILASTKDSIMPTWYKFSIPYVAFRYNMYWTFIIVANTMLSNLGDEDPSLDEESQIAVNHVCRSLEYWRQLKPLGSMSSQLFASVAFGVSSPERREQLFLELEDLYDMLPQTVSHNTMQAVFEIITTGSHKKGSGNSCFE